MNYRIILFSGIMTALIGAMIGLAAATMAERRTSQRDVNERNFLMFGAGLGFVVGSVQESVRQQQALREQEAEEPEDQWRSS